MNHSRGESKVSTAPGIDVPAIAAEGPAPPRVRDLLRRQQALVAMGRRAVAPPEETILVQDAAALVAEMLDADYFSVAELLPEGNSLRLRLAAVESETEEPEEWTATIELPGRDSLAAYVLQVAHPVLVDDLPRDNRFEDLFLRKRGVRSAVAVPLLLQDYSFGVLGAYAKEVGRFDEEDILFVETIAHLVAMTIARKQAEKSLAAERRRSAQVLRTVDAMVLTLDSQWQILDVNRACERITGFTLPELKNRSVWSVFPVAEDEGIARRLQDELRQNTSPVSYESDLLTKHSQRRRIAWSYSAITAGDGPLESIIATGVDVTESREASDKAKRAERAAANVYQAMAKLPSAAGDAPDSDFPDSDFRDSDFSAGDDAGGHQQDASTTGEFSRLPLPIHIDRRKRPRRSYPYRQRVAEVVDGVLPNLRDFVEVLCKDVSAGGFSFFTPRAPSSDTLVVALGVSPKVTYVTAQIAHITRVERGGQRMFLVGCNYIGRARY